MNAVSRYSDEDLAAIIRASNDLVAEKEVCVPDAMRLWLLGGIIEAKRELQRRAEKEKTDDAR